MTELELQQHLLRKYSQENSQCEWKEFKNLKNSFCGEEKDDVNLMFLQFPIWMGDIWLLALRTKLWR